ncbi:MAG: UDP-3-O-(3-hydroxymyristoyl)glucosamine N-acyltransferase [Bdellovibrionaceae bacterium]|nr:UDP-3-O-(3-hydroxymyristoyl)glucosamine N-acyltransferase [Pseudobdellovibrionaceae bacterium]
MNVVQKSNPTLSELLEKYSGLITEAPTRKSTSNSDVLLTCASALDQPKPNSIIFLNELQALAEVIQVQPQVIVLPQKTPEDVLSGIPSDIIILLSPNPKLAMALINKEYFSYSRIDGHFDFSESPIHPTAQIHPTAELGQNVHVGPFAVIGADSKIGNNSKIAAHAVIEKDCELGEGCVIFSHTTIGWRSRLGQFCVVQSGCTIGSDGFGYATDEKGQHHGIPHQGRVILGHHVHIGAGTQIDRGTYGDTIIGDQTKIDNLVHIAHNCKIGRSCLLTAGFMMAGSSELGDFFVAGGGTFVTGHIKVTSNVQVAGKSVVHKSVDKSGSYGGYPLVPLKEHLKNLASLGKITTLRKDIDTILKKTGLR